MHAHTEAVVKEILSLPIHGESSLEDVDYVCDAILEFFDKWALTTNQHERTRILGSVRVARLVASPL